MKKLIFMCAGIVAMAFAGGCNDSIEVQQDYDFAVNTWHLPEDVKLGEVVEIRFTLRRQGDFKGAEYYIGYVQMQGNGAVCDAAGKFLVNRERVALKSVTGLDENDPYALVFTLYYSASSVQKSEVVFSVTDNFGLRRDLMVELTMKQ